MIALPRPDGDMRVAAADGENAEQALRQPEIAQRSKTRAVFERRRSERVGLDARRPGDRPGCRAALGRDAGHVGAARWSAIAPSASSPSHDKLGDDPRFTDEDLRLAEGFAVRASAAVELSERVQRDSLRRVVEAQELERRRLARELHDETGQALTSILLGLKAVEEAKTPSSATRPPPTCASSSSRRCRTCAASPSSCGRRRSTTSGSLPALERLAQTFTEQVGIDVDVEASLGETRLPAEVETALYRLVQEALTNVVKHSRARHVSISLVRRANSVSAVIEDDGDRLRPSRRRTASG